MLFSDEFLQTFSSDPIAGVQEACRLVIGTFTSSKQWTEPELEALEEIDILFTELARAEMMPVDYSVYFDSPDPTRSENATAIRKAIDHVLVQCEQLETRARKEKLVSRIRIGIGQKFAYEFSQGDIDRIQTLLNDLRTQIAESDKFKPDHQRRLLGRLEALQRELHKKVSDLDRFWGLVGDAGVVLAKLGNDAKPIVDRVREIADIVWNTQGRAEELPSSAKAPQIGYESPSDQTEA